MAMMNVSARPSPARTSSGAPGISCVACGSNLRKAGNARPRLARPPRRTGKARTPKRTLATTDDSARCANRSVRRIAGNNARAVTAMMRNITAKSRQMQRAKNTVLFLAAQGPPFGLYNFIELIKHGPVCISHGFHKAGEDGTGVLAVIQHHSEEMLGEGGRVLAFIQ